MTPPESPARPPSPNPFTALAVSLPSEGRFLLDYPELSSRVPTLLCMCLARMVLAAVAAA
jgi:hypothetical protein